mgnify:FL=1
MEKVVEMPKGTRTEIQAEQIETQRKHIQERMRETDEQTKQLLNNDYLLFFGEANK